MKETVKIELTIEDAELFEKFMKYRYLWERLLKLKGGKATIHFDSKGVPRKLEATHILCITPKIDEI